MFHEENTAAELPEAARVATLDLLPQKSRQQYELIFKKFSDWCVMKKVENITESVCLAYFSDRAKQIKPSSLGSEYSMLKTSLLVYKNIDIKDFCKITAFIKRQSVGYTSKKVKVFTKDQIQKFFNQAPNEKYLMMKVVAMFGIVGACRRDELVQMAVSDIKDIGSKLIVKVPKCITNKPRTFVVDCENQNIKNMVESYRKYVSLRPHTPHERLFINYRNGKCFPHPVGVNTFGKVPIEIAKYLGLTNIQDYTGHSLRRSSETILADVDGMISIKRRGRRKRIVITGSGVDEPIENQNFASDEISGLEEWNPTTNISVISTMENDRARVCSSHFSENHLPQNLQEETTVSKQRKELAAPSQNMVKMEVEEVILNEVKMELPEETSAPLTTEMDVEFLTQRVSCLEQRLAEITSKCNSLECQLTDMQKKFDRNVSCSFNASDSKREIQSTTPKTLETNLKEDAVNSLVPSRSSEIYHAAFRKFSKWCEERNVTNYSENELMTYFSYLTIKMNMKSSTMWSHYSMIKSVLNTKYGTDIGKYLKLKAYLKKQNEGHVSKKSRVFTKGQVEKFLSEAPDHSFLAKKIILLIGISGGCRCDELVKMRIDDIEDLGSLLYVKISNNSTNKARTFTIVGERNLNIYRKYSSLRPDGIDTRRFFLKYKNGKCHRSVMGIHTIGCVPKEVASFLGLPKCREYTGHCLRRTSAAQGQFSGTEVVLDCLQ